MRIRTTKAMDFADGFSAPAGTLLIPINIKQEPVDSMDDALLQNRSDPRNVYRVVFDGNPAQWRYVNDGEWFDEDNAVWIEAELSSEARIRNHLALGSGPN